VMPPAPQTATNKLERFKQEAGKRRVVTAAAASVTETVAQLELLTFVIAGEQYAVDIEQIVEIVTPRPVTRIPNADGSVVGIVSLRGTIVTLVDVRRKLHHPQAGGTHADTRIVVVDYHNETVGFIVDRVLRVVKAAPADIEPPPVVHASELDDSIRGVFRVAGSLTILLDLDKLLDSRALAATVA
jgi:purine-binding chemotaxis protein CheW